MKKTVTELGRDDIYYRFCKTENEIFDKINSLSRELDKFVIKRINTLDSIRGKFFINQANDKFLGKLIKELITYREEFSKIKKWSFHENIY